MTDALRRQLPLEGQQAKLLAMLQFLDERLCTAEVPYWVTGGTLLGAVRHAGFIPHDDDVDIELLEADLPRAIVALGAVGRSYRGGGEWLGSGVPMGRVFFWGSAAEARCTSSVDLFLRGSLPLEELQEFPSQSEVFPLQRVPFHNITVAAPRRPDSFLGRCYGATWREEAVVWGHSSRGRELLHAMLPDYVFAAKAGGYVAPVAAATAAASLAAVGLECAGELQEELWESLGWASPYALECAGVDGEDPQVLELLGLESRRLAVDAAALAAAAGAAAAANPAAALEALLDRLRAASLEGGGDGAFFEFTPAEGSGDGGSLHVVGTAEELSAVEAAFKALRRP